MAVGDAGAFGHTQPRACRVQHAAASAIGWWSSSRGTAAAGAGDTFGQTGAVRHDDPDLVAVRASTSERIPGCSDESIRTGNLAAGKGIVGFDYRLERARVDTLNSDSRDDVWSDPVWDDADDASLVVDIDGYEGPLDVLLVLARSQKVDLTQISILQLAEQYLAFIAEARRLSLEVAADYLVMAAWLAYLKSRLLLPEVEDENGPSGPELAAHLTFQLQRLEAMREAAAQLMALNRLGRDVFERGQPEGIRVVRNSVYEVSVFELLRAYADHRVRAANEPYSIAARELFSMEQAHERLRRVLGDIPGWERLEAFLPPEIKGTMVYRSAVSAMLGASLEMAKSGQVKLRQTQTFGPIYMRRRQQDDGASEDG